MRSLYLSVFLILSYTTTAQDYFPPANEWASKPANEVGLNPSIIQEAVDFALDNEYSGEKDLKVAIYKAFEREPYHNIVGPTKERGGPAGMIIKDGYVVAQWGDVNRVDMTFSVTKSYLSTTAGLALDEGLIRSLDDKVIDYVWDGIFEGAHNAKISWDHLLTQSSDWSGRLFGTPDWGDRPPREGGIDDWRRRTLNEPGTVFEYNDVRVNVLAYSLLHVWRKPLPQVLKEKVMDPIGASTTWRWFGYDTSYTTVDGLNMQSVSGGGHNGGGVFINTMDHARFGYLFLNRGKWGDQQLISEEWIDAMTQPSAANVNYGYMWWLNKSAGNRYWEGAPEEVFYAAGFGGNFVIVDPTNNMVVVTRWLEPSTVGTFMGKVIDAIND